MKAEGFFLETVYAFVSPIQQKILKNKCSKSWRTIYLTSLSKIGLVVQKLFLFSTKLVIKPRGMDLAKNPLRNLNVVTSLKIGLIERMKNIDIDIHSFFYE